MRGCGIAGQRKDGKSGAKAMNRISIHKYVGCGDSLFLNSKALNIDNYDHGTEDFEEAVNKAKEVVMREVKKIREDAYRFYSDNSIEFDRY